MKILLVLKSGDYTIKIIHGDITEEDTEAITNAANSHLMHGGGVAGAIVRKGGYEIQEESSRIVGSQGSIPVGKAVITGAGKLKAKYVIHTVGPVWGEGNEDKKLTSAIQSVLELGEEKGIKSVAIPAVSSGIFGFPKERAAKIILDTVISFFETQNPAYLKDVHLTNIDKYTSELFAKEAEHIAGWAKSHIERQ